MVERILLGDATHVCQHAAEHVDAVSCNRRVSRSPHIFGDIIDSKASSSNQNGPDYFLCALGVGNFDLHAYRNGHKLSHHPNAILEGLVRAKKFAVDLFHDVVHGVSILFAGESMWPVKGAQIGDEIVRHSLHCTFDRPVVTIRQSLLTGLDQLSDTIHSAHDVHEVHVLLVIEISHMGTNPSGDARCLKISRTDRLSSRNLPLVAVWVQIEHSIDGGQDGPKLLRVLRQQIEHEGLDLFSLQCRLLVLRHQADLRKL